MQNFTLRDKEKRTIIEVEGRKQGAEWVAICAKHDDHNPSLYINEEKRVYLCRVCDWSGIYITLTTGTIIRILERGRRF